MKLISLYIENFGGLKQYSLDFNEGLTVIREPNGFGKTTLAEFIRTMFYGFPRSTKNSKPREKYTPWTGGSFGGTVTFEEDGRQYRMERSFGATPRSDTFRLIDLATGQRSSRFTENIGLELFRLDADSFERSIYMPQLAGLSDLNTNTIQAKLSDLVEDTDDINNFDKALVKLQTKRRGFVGLRAGTGSVAEAGGQISLIQKELDDALGKVPVLERCKETILQLNGTLEQRNAAVASVRQDIITASEAEASEALRREYGKLAEDFRKDRERADQLRAAYPAGFPSEEELTAVEKTARQSETLPTVQITTQADLAAQSFVTGHAGRFEAHLPSPEETEAVRAKCQQYSSLSLQIDAAVLPPEDQAYYLRWLPHHEAGRLDEDRIGLLSAQQKELEQTLHLLDAAVLPSGDQAYYLKWLPHHEAGRLDEDRIELLSAQQKELEQTGRRLQDTVMSEEETQELMKLENFFGSLPSGEEIRLHRENLALCQQMKQQNLSLAANTVTETPAKKAVSPLPFILLLLLGIGGTAAGIVLMVLAKYLAGGILLGAGVLALMGAIFMGMRMMISKELVSPVTRISPEAQAAIEQNDLRISELENAAETFVRRYLPGGELSEALYQIESKMKEHSALSGKKQALQKEREELTTLAEQLTLSLQEALVPCFGEVSDYESAVRELYLARGRFDSISAAKKTLEDRLAKLEEKREQLTLSLQEALAPCFGEVSDYENAIKELYLARDRFDSISAAKKALEDRLAKLKEEHSQLNFEITGFLSGYYTEVPSEKFDELLTALQRDADTYLRCKTQLDDWTARKTAHEEKIRLCKEELEGFFARCLLQPEPGISDQLQRIRQEKEEMKNILARQDEQQQRLTSMQQEHGEKLSAPAPEIPLDLETLKETEASLNNEIDDLKRRLLLLHQQQNDLIRETDRIPELQAELAEWQEKKAADTKKAELLDQTVRFLQTAKENLSTGYLGIVRQNFTGYIDRFGGEMKKQIGLSTDLGVQLERAGQSRPLQSFSAGQTDLVMLCMRLALVDSLFTEEKVFVILDDPFVNLDDERTAEALALLKELAKERQIIYLVCNSSRSV